MSIFDIYGVGNVRPLPKVRFLKWDGNFHEKPMDLVPLPEDSFERMNEDFRRINDEIAASFQQALEDMIRTIEQPKDSTDG